MRDKILNWFVSGKVGLSSKTMACEVVGLPQDKNWGICHPLDPDDFNRCLLLLKDVPEVRDHFDKIAQLSDVWASIIARWDVIEKCFIDEVGFDWSKGNKASKTYNLMQEIIVK